MGITSSSKGLSISFRQAVSIHVSFLVIAKTTKLIRAIHYQEGTRSQPRVGRKRKHGGAAIRRCRRPW